MRIPALATAAAAIVTLSFAAVYVVAPKLHHFAYWTAKKSAADVEALAKDGWRVDHLRPEPGVDLLGLVRPPGHPDEARWILFLPGNSTDLLAGSRKALDGLRQRGDVGLACWAWRGFEASTGVPTPDALLADAYEEWRRCLTVLGARRQQVEIWGYSLGSGLAVQLAARLCAVGTPPARVVLLSAYDRIAVMPAGPLGRLQRSDVYDAMAAADGVTCPVVLVHGTVDDQLPIDGARALQKAIGDNARLIELPGKGHADYLQQLASLGL